MSPTRNRSEAQSMDDAMDVHREEMLRFARRRVGDLLDAEDLVQQTFLRALANREQLQDRSRLRAWLFRILRNLIHDALRRPSLLSAGLRSDEVAAAEVEGSRETCRCALALAKTLNPRYQEILDAAVLREQPLKVLAASRGINLNNIMVRLHRARRALREKLQAHCGTSSLRACLSCSCGDEAEAR